MPKTSNGLSRDEQERVLFFVKLGSLSADGFIAVYGVVMLITRHQLAGVVLLVCAVVGVPWTYWLVARQRKVLTAQQSAEARRNRYEPE